MILRIYNYQTHTCLHKHQAQTLTYKANGNSEKLNGAPIKEVLHIFKEECQVSMFSERLWVSWMHPDAAEWQAIVTWAHFPDAFPNTKTHMESKSLDFHLVCYKKHIWNVLFLFGLHLEFCFWNVSKQSLNKMSNFVFSCLTCAHNQI